MEITVFTSNQRRHLYLIHELNKICSKLNIVQECDTIFYGQNYGRYIPSKTKKKYFTEVEKAQKKIFSSNILKSNKKFNILSLKKGDLKFIKKKELNAFLKSDYYIIFGSSIIKGSLLKFLKKNKAINIHMGISPYYKGTDCNFWAQFDGNTELVGGTIHYLNEKIDGGDIIFHCRSKIYKNSFFYTMRSVKISIDGLIHYLKNQKIFRVKTLKQKKTPFIRYSKNKEFTDKIINKFLKLKKLKHKNKKYHLHNLFER